MYQRTELRSAVAFFFLFFLHGTSIGTRQQGISYNTDIYEHFMLCNIKINFADWNKPNIFAMDVLYN